MRDGATISRWSVLACAALALSGCGGGAAATSGGAASGAPKPEARTSGQEGEPALTVYVEGPTPAEDTPPGVGPRVYAAEIVVINTGDAPADISEARASFDVWRGDERIECSGVSETAEGGPSEIAPGAAVVYRALALCDLSEPGEYEARARLDFGADAEGGFHREAHHVGRFRVAPVEP